MWNGLGLIHKCHHGTAHLNGVWFLLRARTNSAVKTLTCDHIVRRGDVSYCHVQDWKAVTINLMYIENRLKQVSSISLDNFFENSEAPSIDKDVGYRSLSLNYT